MSSFREIGFSQNKYIQNKNLKNKSRRSHRLLKQLEFFFFWMKDDIRYGNITWWDIKIACFLEGTVTTVSSAKKPSFFAILNFSDRFLSDFDPKKDIGP